jgi:hypothetical protein
MRSSPAKRVLTVASLITMIAKRLETYRGSITRAH